MREMKRRLLNGLRRCKECGRQILMQGYDVGWRIGYLMDKKCLCYECAYWGNLHKHPPKGMEVIGGRCLIVHPPADKDDKSVILGGKGKMRFYMRDDLSVFKSNDVWQIGTVPERFLPKFEDTAIEIPKDLYPKLQKNGKKCKARMCLDRYHCLRYDLSLEADRKKAFNKPPKTWKVGGERCMHFINMDKYQLDKQKTIE